MSITSKTPKILAVTVMLILLLSQATPAQHSVARKWSEMLLTAIRNDFARPPMHARNLFHLSAGMYDAWAVYDNTASTWLLGKTHGQFYCEFDGITIPANVEVARKEAISFAAYRIILHRFNNSPGKVLIFQKAKDLMIELGYNPDLTSVDYTDGLPSSMGNFIAKSIIDFGLQDGSNESNFYRSLFYAAVNPPLIIEDSGNPFILDPNRWQPLFLETFIDQNGNTVPSGAANFLAPEWGGVTPFALNSSVRNVYQRGGNNFTVYHDPGAPPYIQNDGGGLSSEYKFGHTLVSKWASHLDHTDGVMWDISPASRGNIQLEQYPTTIVGYRTFYKENEGGDIGTGHPVNPKTGQPYVPQIVPRGDYTRVLAEFWADGPSSETPPGHWFSILNHVVDHPSFVRKYKGEGEIMDALEWDVKAYFTLGGAGHDAAIACWGIKGWYDYVRPVSAIRYMAAQGQSSDSNLPSYSQKGIPLTPGLVELVQAGDPLAGTNNVNVGKIKLYTWKGPQFIVDPATDVAGVEWILAENWWPYQRPTFVTPPFAGYTSGHSTYSRAAAEVLTYITGDAYFPGGLGEFPAPQNAFLVFEEGPSVNVTLQWATYRDAADQCSLSRIWGGIHPPQDDIPGRLVGRKIGIEASTHAEKYFQGLITGFDEQSYADNNLLMYPNPVVAGQQVFVSKRQDETELQLMVMDSQGRSLMKLSGTGNMQIATTSLKPGLYLVQKSSNRGRVVNKLIVK
jgi:hypothetical protein